MKKLLLILFAFALMGSMAWGQSRESWTETFDDQTSNSYGTSFTCAISGTWTCQDAGNFSYANTNMGSPAFTINDDKPGAQITTPSLNTCGTVSFKYAYINGNSSNVFKLQKSTDGTTFTDLDTHTLGASANLSYVNYSYDVNDASATVYIRVLSDDQNAHLFIEDFSVTNYSASSPTITLSTTSLSGFSYVEGSGPSAEQTFTVEGSDLTNDITLTAPTDYEISETSGSGYTSPITLTQSGGSVATTTIYVRLKAGLSAGTYNSEDITVASTGATSKTVTCDGTVYKQEPTNHVTGFSATAASSSQIDLSWTENDGAVVPDGYLIIASTGAVSDPTDGTDPADDTDLTDGAGNVKVAHGTTSYSFTDCSATTTYNFKIYPYTNSGSSIDFKTDGTVPSASATTDAPAVEPQVGDLYITEVAGDGIDGNNNDDGFMEIYNASDHEISLANVSARYYNSNPGAATQTVSLSGSIASGAFKIVTQDGTNFNSTYGFSADFSGSTFYFNGGDDGCDIYHSTVGILDQFNEVGSGSSPWTWIDSYSWERNSTGSGATQANWTQTSSGTPKSFGIATWTGNSTSTWNSDANWTFITPTSSMDVTIPSGASNYPSIDGDATTPSECNNLTIASGANLTIPTGKALTVYGDYTNNATASDVTLQSAASATTGSLIVEGTVTGNSTMERYIAPWSSSSATDGWHLISSPVTGQEISTEFVDVTATPISSDVDFYRWSETEDLYINIKKAADGSYNQGSANTNFSNDASPVFAVGTGYLIAYGTSAVTKNFTGVFNTADVSISGLTNTSGNTSAGWHLLGNPYPSALYWNNTAWSLSDIDATAKVWDEGTASYTDVAAGGILPAMQGFMVHVTTSGSTSGSLTIDASDRVHDATTWYKNSTNEENTLKLTVSEEQSNTAQESIVKINEDATAGFDPQFDSHFLAGFAPQFYSVLEDGSAVSTNTLPDVSENTSIPFNFIKNSAADYTLTVDGVNSLTTGEKVYLTDLKTNYTQNLNENPVYHFSAQEGDAVNRFKLYFGPLGVNENSAKSLYSVYASHNLIKIQTEKAVNAQVFVYNVAGQLMAKTTLNQQTYTSIDMKDFKGMAVVSIVSAGTARNHKVIVY